MAPSGQATAAFSARTASFGNTWSVGGAAVRLAFATNPSGSTGGIPFATQPVVAVQDAGGNTVTLSAAPVTLSITTPAGAALTCTANPKSAVSGVVAFAGCRINRTGTYTLTATSSGLTNAVSTSFTIFGPATKLAFTASPPNSAGGIPFATQPVVAVQDAGGNTVTSSTASVTLSLTSAPGGATLTCTANPRNAVSGVVAFAGCRINKKGTYTLTAISGTLTTAVSIGFTIG